MTAIERTLLAVQDLDEDARAALASIHRSSLADLDDSGLHRLLGSVSRILRSTRDGIALHGAAVRLCDGRGLLATGPTGAGKSTLAAALGIHRGAAFVSDDTVWLDDSTVRGFGAPLAIRCGSPIAASVPQTCETGARIVAHPSALGMRGTVGSTPVSIVVFPEIRVGPPTAFGLDPSETFCRLMGAVFGLPSPQQVLELATFATSVASAAIGYENIDGSMTAVDDVVELVADPEPARRPLVMLDEELAAADVASAVMGLRFGEDDVVLWHPSVRRCVRLGGWPRGTSIRHTPVHEQLRSLGFLRHDAGASA